jgi:hypothetical protein
MWFQILSIGNSLKLIQMSPSICKGTFEILNHQRLGFDQSACVPPPNTPPVRSGLSKGLEGGNWGQGPWEGEFRL